MHIALLAPLPPAQSGIADYAQTFMQHLQVQGIEVSTPLLGIQHAQLNKHMPTVDWAGYDCVHAELGGGHTLEFTALQWLMQHAPGVKLTATVHDPERLVWRMHQLPKGLNWISSLSPFLNKFATLLADPLTIRAERQLAHHIKRLITLTHTGSEALKQRMKLDARQCVIVPHGNNCISYQALPPAHPVRLLYFGFIYRGKGIETILHALAKLFKQHPELKECYQLTLSGGTRPTMTFEQDDNYRNELEELSEHLGLSDIVKWQTNIKDNDIVRIIQAHHVLILPYQESRRLAMLGKIRGTSGVLSWANACARGVITSDARAFPEEVSHGNGILYPQGNTTALAACIYKLVEEPGLCSKWSESAAVQGRDREWPRIIRLFIDVFKEL